MLLLKDLDFLETLMLKGFLDLSKIFIQGILMPAYNPSILEKDYNLGI